MALIEASEVVGGKYKLARPLGRGSMGEVWVAYHQTLSEEVAIKLLTPTPASDAKEDASAAARFRFEAQIAARLSRKTRHIVRVTDHGEENGLAYLVMELLEGETLEKRLMTHGTMAAVEVSRVVLQIARALERAHDETVVHRDLKPANVFLARDEDGGMLVKVLDFGIARAIRTQRISATFSTGEGLVFGTPGYMSPEQACGAKLDVRADLWALSTVAYEALTGELPLHGASAEEILANLQLGNIVPVHERNPDLPAGLAEFFGRAFAPRIEDRFANARELARAFEHALGFYDQTMMNGKARSERPPASVESTTVSVGSNARRSDTLPMALGPRIDPKSSPPRRAARRRLVSIAPALFLLGIAIAIPAWRTRPHAAVTPLAATAQPHVDALATPIAPAPAQAPPASPEPAETPPAVASVPEVPPRSPPADSTARASLSHAPAAVPSPRKSQLLTAPAATPPVTTPSATPPRQKPIDKSAVL